MFFLIEYFCTGMNAICSVFSYEGAVVLLSCLADDCIYQSDAIFLE